MGRLFVFCSTTERSFLLRSKISTIYCVQNLVNNTTYSGSKVSFFKIQKAGKFGHCKDLFLPLTVPFPFYSHLILSLLPASL